MLKKRILTAMILIPVFVGLVLELPPRGFCILTGLIVVWASWEWSHLLGVKNLPRAILYPFFMIIVMVGTGMLLAKHIISLPHVLGMTVGFWLIAAMMVMSYPASSFIWGRGILWRAVMGIMVLIPAWLSLNFIRIFPNGILTLFVLFILIWGADISAYFTGKKWGKRKILPLVSPGKTWMGLLGAMITTFFIMLIILFAAKVPYNRWTMLFCLAWTTVLFSVLGDLFESMLKRQEGLKDSGHLLPGHGGILDRIDSLTAAAPIFALGLIVLN